MNFQDLVTQLINAGLPVDSLCTPETLIEVLVYFMDGKWEIREEEFYYDGGMINGAIVDQFGWHATHGFYDWAGYPIEV